ncbi:methionine synthase II [Ascobolus immersus RN42]|uniref:Methionine synthase II n=1 Tax=Ascobolus immersus RN42 TaxID=1160509 RepID=A0A3N4IFQ3_ASCIM|nr:methionine synthase II [Ascobolus immersus RN42]
MTSPPKPLTLQSEPVGSLPRPSHLQEALAAYDENEITLAELRVIEDEASRDALEIMERCGQDWVTAGEHAESSFATYALMETLGGKGLAKGLKPGGAFFAIFEDDHHRQLPILRSGPFRYKTYAAELLQRTMRYAKRPLKQAVISPSMLSLLYPDEGIVGYPRDEFYNDLVDECEKDIRMCFQVGVKRVSIDFTEGRLALKNDPRNPWTEQGRLGEFIQLNNRVLERFNSDERTNIGIHTCPGGDCDSFHSHDVKYKDLLPSLFQLNAGYFLIQASGEPDRESVYKLVGKYLRKNAAGVKQMAFIGVVDPTNPRIESPEEVRDQLLLAAKYIPKDRLGSTDDCGFSPFSIDPKPKHGGPDQARLIASRKMRARVKGTRMASEALRLKSK